MLKKLLLSVSLLLPAAPHAAEPDAKAGVTKTSKAPAASRRTAKKPAGAKAAARKRATARPGTATGQAAAPDPRMQFLQRFADADDDADGLLSRKEAERNLPAVGETFDSADASGDGWLTPEELRSFLQIGRSSEPHG